MPDRPVVLLLHGLGGTAQDWGTVVGRLTRSLDVLAPDLPGAGAQPPLPVRPTVPALTDWLERVLDEQGLEQVHVLGASLGGRLALELARRGRARSVVAIAPSGLDVPPERAVQATGMVLAGAVARLVRPVAGPLTRSPLGRTLLLANLRARPWAATPQEAQAAVDGFGAPDFYRLLLWSTVLDVPVRPRRAPCPVVLVQGTFDWVSLGQVPRWLLLLPGSRFRVLPWAGHEPLSDVPDRIVRLALDTIARAGPDRSSRAQAHR